MARMPTEVELRPFVQGWLSAARGQRTRVVSELAERFAVSLPTAYDWLRVHRFPTLNGSEVRYRKRRCDAGQSGLLEHEAKIIGAAWLETIRENGKGRAPLHKIMEMLRANGIVRAERIDESTGELLPLSDSAILRALRLHRCHPDQLSAVRPAQELRSPEPNWCWQVDASVCRQYYLADDGTRAMSNLEFYRGKPKNFDRISDRRIWRYVVTDHCTSALEVLYVQGAESTANLITALIHAMTRRKLSTMYGVPKYLMTDPGSGMTSRVTSNFLTALGIELITNQVGNARAKGQVENGNYLVETLFESTLRFQAPVMSIAEMNQIAERWCYDFGATRIHSRTGMTRRDAWMRIERLQLAPEPAVLMQLPLSDPKSCQIRHMRLRFDGQEYDVRELPGVAGLKEALVVANPFESRTVRVLVPQVDGRTAHFIAPRVERDAYGKSLDAAIVGSEFKSLPESPEQARAKELERLVMGAETDEAAKKARRRKQLPFGGQINPLKAVEQRTVPTALPRAGRAAVLAAAPIAEAENLVPIRQERWVPKPLEQYQMLMELRRRFEARGRTWGTRQYEEATLRWPQGVLEEDLDACVLALMTPALRALAGSAE